MNRHSIFFSCSDDFQEDKSMQIEFDKKENRNKKKEERSDIGMYPKLPLKLYAFDFRP